MSRRAAIILAAGKGTRMKSSLPKVLHPVGGRPVLDWVLALARSLNCEMATCVISPDSDVLKAHVEGALGAENAVIQSPALGTGHAVQCAEDRYAAFDGKIVVLYGDSPLVPEAAIEALFQALDEGADLGVLGFEAANPGLYGRLIVNDDKSLDAIVEARDATDAQKQIRLCNSGVMAGDAKTMFRLIKSVTNDNAKGEYYLTDLVALARAEGKRCAVVTAPEDDLIGCDTRADLAEAEASFQKQARRQALEAGVTLTAPETVFFSYDTSLENDVFVAPNVVFGPGVTVASGSRILSFSHLEGVDVGANCQIGPHARLRPGAVLGQGVRIGNFVEVKNAVLGEGAKANHLAYIGDGDVGAGANLGAGTVFCNYDGFEKHRTQVGDGAFVGSNSSLVAPVSIGDRAYVASGSVITDNVTPAALAIGRGRQIEKPGWADAFRAEMTARKTTKKGEG
ncbi:MAG: bifunctional UDP-N-acetylglucosamine diphosphorylase/glucosamine-1-phosphate N-acetyltransferase GlmU [Pseudomonadota bacterium]